MDKSHINLNASFISWPCDYWINLCWMMSYFVVTFIHYFLSPVLIFVFSECIIGDFCLSLSGASSWVEMRFHFQPSDGSISNRTLYGADFLALKIEEMASNFFPVDLKSELNFRTISRRTIKIKQFFCVKFWKSRWQWRIVRKLSFILDPEHLRNQVKVKSVSRCRFLNLIDLL